MLPHFVWAGFPRRARRPRARRLRRSTRTGSRRTSSSASRSTARSSTAASSSSCARRSSPGTCSARRARPAAPCATSIPRSSGCRSRSTGFDPARHVVTCNGRRVPLTRPAAPASASPACASGPGSRRRRCTRPSPVHAPLIFDIVDTWNGRSLGGCVYHVAHPGGRNYETFPVNAYEAEARRLARFEEHGHTPGPFAMPPAETLARVPDDARPAASDSDLMARHGSCSTALRRRRRGPRTAACRGYQPLARHLRRDDGSRTAGVRAALAAVSVDARRRSGPTRSTGASPRPTGICATPACSTGSMTTGRSGAALAAQPCAAADRCRAEWQALEAGLIQRAELLEAILADIYGPAKLVRDGAPAGRGRRRQSGIPAAAGRRRAVRRRASAVLRRRSRPRSPDGRWWVLGDRTQAPSGAGYALENRLALSRAMPDIYRQLQRRARSRRSSRRCRRDLSALSRRDDSPRLRADARAAERDLFRARLSRPLSRLPAGRGRGPDRPRRRRVHPHRVGLEARRRAAAPPRCRFRRSAGAERRARGSAFRAWCRRSATAPW